MSCKHGNWEPCEECEAEEKAWDAAFEAGKKEGWEACETCHGIVDGVHQQLSLMTQAVGLVSTMKPNMKIDVSDPVGMMQEVIAAVKSGLETYESIISWNNEKVQKLEAENKRLREALAGAWLDGYCFCGPEGYTDQQKAVQEALAATESK